MRLRYGGLAQKGALAIQNCVETNSRLID